MQQIRHEFWIDRAIGAQENIIHVEEEYALTIGEVRDQFPGAKIGGIALLRITPLGAE